MARTLKYGESTVLFAKKVPKSKLQKVEALVDKYLGTVEMDVAKSRHDFGMVEEALQKVLKDKGEIPELEAVFKDETIRKRIIKQAVKPKKIIVPRQNDEGGNPPEKAVEAPKKVIRDSKTGFTAYPCGCMDDGLLRKNPVCKIGDQKMHKIVFE